ncbi:uncharacterized protein UTRI_06670 [Ustilago trichophora]|uniref:BZIP domain-containing protein n=1 Tax=Ustilago trichophora TaxID=86804 RepID=A0A5C3EMK3_9BASI|nr:uncharacterized protein UTRI_06670 [Ustilago trichophora]
MAATQVARNPSFTAFDDIVKMPSSPTLQPRARTTSNAPLASSSSSSSSTSTPPAAFNMRKVGLDENQPPPPVGSSPEVFFRYYLAVELRKAGTQPSEALLDRYVRNHFDSLFKNKNAATPAPAAQPSTNITAPSTQPHASTSQVTVAAVARPPPPPPPPPHAKMAPAAALAVSTPRPAAPAAAFVPASIKDTASPPELDTAESPALSGRSYSPVATPPALNSITQDDALVDFATVFGEPSSSLLQAPSHALGNQVIKFEDDSDQMLGFFRNSPFRTTDYESATIDPHVVENNVAGAQPPFSMPLASISPSDLAAQSQHMSFSTSLSSLKHDDTAPMSEDGMSDDDEHDDDHSRHSSPSKSSSGSKPLSTIPMAVGDINYLKPDPEEYKKLSSKEKRQLRNKISARNFRTRRKEYITQLEEQIADRDAIIEGLRQQISSLSVENKSLKDEVKTIKARTISTQDVGKILEALQSITSPTTAGTAGNLSGGVGGITSGRTSPTQEMPLTPGAFLNFGDASSSSSRPGTPTLAVPGSPRSQSPRPSLLRRSSPSLLPQPNTKKDVAPSSSFWGGVGSGVGAGGSFMPVC